MYGVQYYKDMFIAIFKAKILHTVTKNATPNKYNYFTAIYNNNNVIIKYVIYSLANEIL